MCLLQRAPVRSSTRKDLTEFFHQLILQHVVTATAVARVEGQYDIKANLDGGGGLLVRSQALRLTSLVHCWLTLKIRKHFKDQGSRHATAVLLSVRSGQPAPVLTSSSGKLIFSLSLGLNIEL